MELEIPSPKPSQLIEVVGKRLVNELLGLRKIYLRLEGENETNLNTSRALLLERSWKVAHSLSVRKEYPKRYTVSSAMFKARGKHLGTHSTPTNNYPGKRPQTVCWVELGKDTASSEHTYESTDESTDESTHMRAQMRAHIWERTYDIWEHRWEHTYGSIGFQSLD